MIFNHIPDSASFKKRLNVFLCMPNCLATEEIDSPFWSIVAIMG